MYHHWGSTLIYRPLSYPLLPVATDSHVHLLKISTHTSAVIVREGGDITLEIILVPKVLQPHYFIG